VVTSILLKPNLRRGIEFSRKHDPGHTARRWMFKEAPGQLSQPEPIGHLIVIDPRDDLVFDHLYGEISRPGESRPRLDNIGDGN
jgi:hypothetical protein